MRKLESIDDWNRFVEQTGDRPLFVFKHSTRCPISASALDEYRAFVEDGEDSAHALVDVIDHRDVSNGIAARTGIRHESPQALLLHGGSVRWNESHGAITKKGLEKAIDDAKKTSGAD